MKQDFGNAVRKKKMHEDERRLKRGQGKAKKKPEKVAYPHRGRHPTGRELGNQNFIEKSPQINEYVKTLSFLPFF